MRTGAVRRDWLPKAVLCFPFIFTFATKFPCTAGEVAQTMTFSDGQYLYFPLFSVLETLGFNLLKVKCCLAQLNFLGTALVTEIITLMLNTSHKRVVVALDCPVKIDTFGGFLAWLDFLLESHLGLSCLTEAKSTLPHSG